MIPNFIGLLIIAFELIFAFLCAGYGDVALTIVFCFSAYCCLQLMEKNKEGK